MTLARAYNLMNEGDLAVEKKDDAGALKAYSAAAGDRPRQRRDDVLDGRVAGRDGEGRRGAAALPRRRSRSTGAGREMTPRLPKAGLLPDDPALIARIVAEAPTAP